MKNKWKIIVTSLLVLGLLAALMPTPVYTAVFGTGKEKLQAMSGYSAEEIYDSRKGYTAEELIGEIVEMEKELSDEGDEEKMALLPQFAALFDKQGEISADRLIELIKSPDTDVALESVLVEMYVRKGADQDALYKLLGDDDIDSYTKYNIVATADFSAEQLQSIIDRFDDNVAVVAMKRLSVKDRDAAIDAAGPIFEEDLRNADDEKVIAACLGAAAYYEKIDPKDLTETQRKNRDSTVAAIKDVYHTSKSSLVKDQAIYALARIADYEIFCYIIEADDIDDELKLTTVERNAKQLIEYVSEAESFGTIKPVLKAMKILPIIEIGETLEKAAPGFSEAESEEIMKVVEMIRTEGINMVDKYEKF